MYKLNVTSFTETPKHLDMISSFENTLLVYDSVCDFQPLKRSVELDNLLLKFFCYVTWFDEKRHWRPYKWGLFVKSYCFFEIIAYRGLKTATWILGIKTWIKYKTFNINYIMGRNFRGNSRCPRGWSFQSAKLNSREKIQFYPSTRLNSRNTFFP